MKAILVDTGPVYALTDPSDQYHRRASAELEALQGMELPIQLAFPVMVEAHTLILRRLGVEVALRWLEQIELGTGLLNPTRDLYLTAARRLHLYNDQPITLVDAVLTTLSTDLQVPIWTYDHHFDVMRAAVWRPGLDG